MSARNLTSPINISRCYTRIDKTNIRGLFNKYPCLSTEDTTDAKCHYLTPSFKRWLKISDRFIECFCFDSCYKLSSSCLFPTMEKEQYRLVIRFLFWVGKTCEEIKVKLHAVYKDYAPSMTTIRYWFNEHKRGRTSVFDEERPGRPIELTTENMVKNNPWYRVGRPPGEDQRDCWHCRHLNWTLTKYPTRKNCFLFFFFFI